MASLEHLDMLIGESLENIIKAAHEIKDIKILDSSDSLMRIGKSVSELWAIRENIYRIRPDLKRDVAVEYDKDKKRYEDLNKIQEEACKAIKDGQFEIAEKLYEELLTTSRFGFFRLIAEAGLYRLSNRTKSD